MSAQLDSRARTVQLAGSRVLVVGLGVSGAAAATALLHAGVGSLAVADRRDDPTAREQAAALTVAGAQVLLGEVPPAVLLDPLPDLIVTSPGVPAASPLLGAAADAGVPVWSEPELGWRLNGGRTRLVAVTGTNGKTSTTELLAECLGAPAAGNIGAPLTALLTAAAPPPLAVVELSSFQLHFTHTLRPHVAVLLNVAPDHLDWHGSLAAYAADKSRIWAAQEAEDWAVVNADDEGARQAVTDHPPPGRTVAFTLGPPAAGQVGVDGGQVVARLGGGERVGLVAVDGLAARGPHNLANVLAATAAALAAGGEPAAVTAAVLAYRPGRHRLEVVADSGGVTWVDDSKATNPHAAAAAIASFDRIVWIAGGLNKGLSFDPLVEVIQGRVRVAITIGEAGPDIAQLTRAAGIHTVDAGTLDRAVAAARELATPGDVILLAPACASMDQFTDYAERGEVFRREVHGGH